MIRKRAEKDTVNPPGQIVNFEKPIIKQIEEYKGNKILIDAYKENNETVTIPLEEYERMLDQIMGYKFMIESLKEVDQSKVKE